MTVPVLPCVAVVPVSRACISSYFNIYKYFHIVCRIGGAVQLESNSHLAHKLWKTVP